jgi:hypothetical protein
LFGLGNNLGFLSLNVLHYGKFVQTRVFPLQSFGVPLKSRGKAALAARGAGLIDQIPPIS